MLAALLWAVATVTAVRFGQPHRWRTALQAAGEDWPAAVGVVAAATLTAALLAEVLTEPMRRLWLGGCLPGPMSRLLRRWRTRRWQAASPRHRVRIALAEPRSPTWIGDRRLALESRIRHEYGLDLASVWPRLWLVLPESTRAELRRAEQTFHDATRWAAWSLVYAVTAVAWWPIAGLAVLTLVRAVRSGRAAAATVTDLGEAATDLYAAHLARRLGLRVDGQTLEPDVGARINARCRKGA
ncbi:hypothetical protein AB0J90_30770 [Micromonospora sp. NPDC049523]|uniref:hypothetical protein n=1 Tax=Micromonospora sp. NPDC049523 TaxID=3155921 RepID=UPI00342A8F5D